LHGIKQKPQDAAGPGLLDAAKDLLFVASRFWLQTVIENVRRRQRLPVVPNYGGEDEYSPQRQLTYQPIRGAWPPAAPRGLRPIGGNVFGGNPFGAQPPGYSGSAVTGYNDILAAQRLWSSFLMGMNRGR
jgi:hypothetical protein